MKHIAIGMVAIVIGLWGIALNWYQFVDLLWVLIPMGLIAGGIVAMLAGITNFRKSSKRKSSPQVDEKP